MSTRSAARPEMLQLSQTYSVAVLKAGPAYGSEIAAPIVWEHGRRNFETAGGWAAFHRLSRH
jgi:hypothetical protein